MRLAALLLPLLVVPGAAACSFAGEAPPGPGAFVMTDLEDGTQWSVEVEQRGLGGLCELSNLHALAGGWLAWVEGGRLRAQDIHASVPSVDLPFTARATAITLFDGNVLAIERERIVVIDLETGAERAVDSPSEGTWTAKKHLVAFRDTYEGPGHLSVYDARADAWIVRGRDMSELGPRWWPWLVEEGWLVLHSEPESAPSRYHLVDLVTGQMRDLQLPPDTATVDLDQGSLYLRVMKRDGQWLDPHVLARMPVEGGSLEEVATLVGEVGAVVDGLALVQAYSLPRYEPLRLLGGEPTVSPAPPTPAASATPVASPQGTTPVNAVPLDGTLPLAALLLLALARPSRARINR